jgi:hypothetical protein
MDDCTPPQSPRFCAPESPAPQQQLQYGVPQTPAQQPLLQPQQLPFSSPAPAQLGTPHQQQLGGHPPPMSPFPNVQQPRILQTPQSSSQRSINAHTQARMMR